MPKDARKPPDPRDRASRPLRRSGLIWPILFALSIVWMLRSVEPVAHELAYSEFKHLLAAGAVTEVVISEHEIEGLALSSALKADDGKEDATTDAEETETDPEAEPESARAEDAPAEPETTRFHTARVDDDGLVAELESAGIPYSGAPQDVFGPFLLSWLFPIGLLVLLFWFFRSAARRAGTSMMGFGKSKAKLVPETGTGVTFADVAGCEEAKAELGEMVQFLKAPSHFTALGGKIPKGVLLLGPPGTGKTLLARAVAGEAGVPFFSLTGSDFVEMFVGVGAARVRDLFEQAKAKAPCIVFIDEVDAIGRQRGVSMGVVNDEREQTLNQLLSEMDGFENNSGVILLAATNRPEILDRALLRPGRFDRQVTVDSPDLDGREAILRVHVRDKPLADDVDLRRIAQATPGMSGADLANVLNEAALATARAGRSAITQQDLEAAIEKVVAGPERRSRRLSPEEKERVAYHESGHALVAARSEHGDPVQKITIVPRGRAALGYTMQLPEKEHFLNTRPQLLDRIRMLLGGRAAEQVVFGEISTGAQDDLRVATDIARQMICVFGMSEKIGLQQCASADGSFLRDENALRRDCSEATAREVDEEVRQLLDSSFESAVAILRGERDVLERVAQTLLERETLDRATFEQLTRPAESTATHA